MLKFNVTIKGVAPLLFNRYPEEENPDGVSKGKKAVLSKDAQVERSLYKDDKGQIVSPSDHIVGAMTKAAVNFKLEGKKTFKDVAKAGVFISPLQIPHLNQQYVADWRPVIINRGRVMKGRGRMDDWSLKFELVCIDDRATANDIKEILEYAGTYIGIGDYRPRYGRFEVTDFTKV